MPAALVKVEPAAQRQLRLDKGLGSPDAETVLRELDDDGHLGLRGAPDELLDGLRRHTRGFPRALEAVKAILENGGGTLTPRDLLDRTRQLPEDQVVQVLVGEAYDLLDAPAQQVMQALAVYPAPVSAVGVDFLLRPVNPTIDAAPILTRLVRRQLARFHDGHYYLHPVDRDYARSQLPPGSPGNSAAAFTLTALQARAADYYAQIRTPRESWRTLDDVRPQLAEFELRCDTGDYDTAATVLADIDFDYLQVWGHYRTLIGLHGRIHGRITDPALNAAHLSSLGNCRFRLGEYERAIDLYTQALAIARDTGDRQGEGASWATWGSAATAWASTSGPSTCTPRRWPSSATSATARSRAPRWATWGSATTAWASTSGPSTCTPRRWPSPATSATARARAPSWAAWGSAASAWASTSGPSTCTPRRWPSPATPATARARAPRWATWGTAAHSLGEYERAIDLHTQALAIFRDIGDRQGEGAALGNLGLCRYSLGEYERAIDLHAQALAIARDIGDRYGEANALDYLGRAWLASGEARRAVTLLEQAVSIADITGDIEPAVEARSWLARARLQLGDPAAALTAAAAGRELPYPAEEPAIRLLEGLALLGLHRREESVQAFRGALAAADALLALADSNVAALQARALALSGLAAATGDPARAAEAGEAFARADAVTGAAGVAADTRRLLDQIACHDQSGILAQIRAAPDP